MSASGFDPAAEAAWIHGRLERLAARPAWGKQKIALRIAVPNLRQVLQERQPVLAAADDAGLVALAETLWNGVTYDEMHIAVEVLRLRPTLISEDLIDRLRPAIDTRAVADDLASVVREWVAADPEPRFGALERWAAEPYAWSRWLALASTALLSRRGAQTDRTIALVSAVMADRRPTVVSAVSRALREIAKSDPATVTAFIDRHADDLPARVRLEVRNKLRFGRTDGKPQKKRRAESRPKRTESRRGTEKRADKRRQSRRSE
jgi:3-methyladenine DNA glycosylase AlkD